MAVESLLSITSFTSSLWILILRAWTILLEKKRVTVRRLLHLLLNAHASLGPVLPQNLKDTGLTGLRLFFGGWYFLYGSCYGYHSIFCVCSLNEARELPRAQEGTNIGHVLARLTPANTMMFPTVLLIEDAALLRFVTSRVGPRQSRINITLGPRKFLKKNYIRHRLPKEMLNPQIYLNKFS